jgi:hypothetical protein
MTKEIHNSQNNERQALRRKKECKLMKVIHNAEMAGSEEIEDENQIQK